MNTKDQQFQDYLDDRMTREEKAAFEQALAREPELAGSLAEHLRMREALREEETLPPGFYTRARAEFEERHGSRKRRIFGLPWEAVGLAAATGLALALFVPSLIRDELPVAPSLGEATGSREMAERQSEPAADFADDETVAGEAATEGLVGVEQAESTPGIEKKKVSKALPPIPADPKEELRLDEASAAKPAAPATEPAPKRSPPPAAPTQKQRVFAPSPPAPADRDESVAEVERRAQLSAGRPEQAFGKAIDATPLQVGAVLPYTVRSLESGDPKTYVDVDVSGKANAESGDGAAASAVAPQGRGANEGLVLIGPRETPFSCVGLRLESLPDQLVVYLGSVGPDRPASPGGCAIYLPNDDRPIVVVDP